MHADSRRIQFEREGFILCEATDESRFLASEIRETVISIGKSLDRNFSLDDPQSVFDLNRKGFYNAVRHVLPLYELIVSATLRQLAAELGVRRPAAGPSAVRLDVFEEPSHQFGWHQDAASLLGSKNMYTYWIPCTSVSVATGSVEVLPRSHTNGLFSEVSARDSNLKSDAQSQNLILNGQIKATIGTTNIIEADIGSVLVMSPFLVHRSHYPKTSHSCRVTAIIRLDDLGDLHHLELGAKSALSQHNIVNSPEYSHYYGVAK